MRKKITENDYSSKLDTIFRLVLYKTVTRCSAAQKGKEDKNELAFLSKSHLNVTVLHSFILHLYFIYTSLIYIGVLLALLKFENYVVQRRVRIKCREK